MAYVLLAITGSGLVSSAKFETLDACRDARSLVLYGETVAEKSERDAAYAAAEKKREEDWYAAHPPRQPATDREKDASARKSGLIGWVDGHVTRDGLIQDDPPSTLQSSGSYNPSRGESVERFRGGWLLRQSGDVVKAYCFADIPGELTP